MVKHGHAQSLILQEASLWEAFCGYEILAWPLIARAFAVVDRGKYDYDNKFTVVSKRWWSLHTKGVAALHWADNWTVQSVSYICPLCLLVWLDVQQLGRWLCCICLSCSLIVEGVNIDIGWLALVSLSEWSPLGKERQVDVHVGYSAVLHRPIKNRAGRFMWRKERHWGQMKVLSFEDAITAKSKEELSEVIFSRLLTTCMIITIAVFLLSAVLPIGGASVSYSL